MGQIDILDERESGSGWTFRAELRGVNDERRRYDVRLSWADYNLWSADGADPPSEVARAALAFLAEQSDADDLKASFDAAVLRRRYADADQRIPALIRRP